MIVHCDMCPKTFEMNNEEVKGNAFQGTTLKCGHTLCAVCKDAWTSLSLAKDSHANCPTCDKTYAVSTEPKRPVKFEDILSLFDKVAKIYD